MKQHDIGLIGLAVMGQNLVLNMANNGFSVAVYNRTTQKTLDFMNAAASGKDISGAYSLKEFTGLLKKSRRIVLMVKAGKPVDDFIDQLKPYLEKGDILIDAGNSFFGDTERRTEDLENAGINYIGTGVSGGDEGALKGPSIMPGGQKEAYAALEPILTKIAARVNGEPCCAYIGPRGAGHYVKMVHNGIEYGIMQLLAEVYDFFTRGLGYSATQLAEVINDWNAGELSGYLMEITGKILGKADLDTGKPLVEVILDTAQQKGTGKWTSQNAFDLGVPIPTINAAVEGRILSAHREERLAAAKFLTGPASTKIEEKADWITLMCDALHASIITSYAQGLALIRVASREYGYDIHMEEVAKIWRGGCIIRAAMLEPIRMALKKNPSLSNLMMDETFGKQLNSFHPSWRKVVTTAVQHGIPCLAMSASLGYFDMYREERLPANLTQAQRDFFGAHTYNRIDKEGVFHTIWSEE